MAIGTMANLYNGKGYLGISYLAFDFSWLSVQMMERDTSGVWCSD